MNTPDTWNEWLGSSQLSKEQRRAHKRFASSFGLAFSFLFLEHAGRLVLDLTREPRRRFNFGSVWTIETAHLDFRFSRYFREVLVEVTPHNANVEWVDLQAAALLLLAGELNGDGNFPPQKIDLPPEAYVLQNRFHDLEALFTAGNLPTTRRRLDAIYRSRGPQGPLEIIRVSEPTLLSKSGFLSNYDRLSNDISRVPFWKPLGIYVGMILMLPLLLLFLVFMAPMRFFRPSSSHPRLRRRH